MGLEWDLQNVADAAQEGADRPLPAKPGGFGAAHPVLDFVKLSIHPRPSAAPRAARIGTANRRPVYPRTAGGDKGTVSGDWVRG